MSVKGVSGNGSDGKYIMRIIISLRIFNTCRVE